MQRSCGVPFSKSDQAVSIGRRAPGGHPSPLTRGLHRPAQHGDVGGRKGCPAARHRSRCRNRIAPVCGSRLKRLAFGAHEQGFARVVGWVTWAKASCGGRSGSQRRLPVAAMNQLQRAYDRAGAQGCHEAIYPSGEFAPHSPQSARGGRAGGDRIFPPMGCQSEWPRHCCTDQAVDVFAGDLGQQGTGLRGPPARLSGQRNRGRRASPPTRGPVIASTSGVSCTPSGQSANPSARAARSGSGWSQSRSSSLTSPITELPRPRALWAAGWRR